MAIEVFFWIMSALAGFFGFGLISLILYGVFSELKRRNK